jgi:hypothetical protein
MIFGGADGANTSLLLVACAAGGDLNWPVALLVSLSFIVGSALATSIAEFLSCRAHGAFLVAERRRALWELKNGRSAEMDAMVRRFETRGVARPDAEVLLFPVIRTKL